MNKKKLQIFGTLLGLFAFGCQSHNNTTGPKLYTIDSVSNVSPDSPNLIFKHFVFDFGKVKEGAIVRHSFEMVNMGKAPVVISKVQTTCGCTTAYWPKSALGFRHPDSIDVQLHTQGNSGMQEKNILVFSNSANKIIVLTIKGIIEI